MKIIKYKCDRCGGETAEAYRFKVTCHKAEGEAAEPFPQPFDSLDLCLTCAIRVMGAINGAIRPDGAPEKPPVKVVRHDTSGATARRNYLNTGDKTTAEKMFADGRTIQEIADALNIYPNKVKTYLLTAGIIATQEGTVYEEPDEDDDEDDEDMAREAYA